MHFQKVIHEFAFLYMKAFDPFTKYVLVLGVKTFVGNHRGQVFRVRTHTHTHTAHMLSLL